MIDRHKTFLIDWFSEHALLPWLFHLLFTESGAVTEAGVTPILVISISSRGILCVVFQKNCLQHLYIRETSNMCSAEGLQEQDWETVVQGNEFCLHTIRPANIRLIEICVKIICLIFFAQIGFSQSMALFQSLMSCLAVYGLHRHHPNWNGTSE